MRLTLEEQGFSCFKKLEFTFNARDRIEFSVAGETITGVVCVSDRAEDGGEVRFLPYRRSRFTPEIKSASPQGFAWCAYFSPLKSTT